MTSNGIVKDFVAFFKTAPICGASAQVADRRYAPPGMSRN
jgi:hypothetical protein